MTELPTTFGKYFLTEQLATGGMAEIYLGKILGPGGFEKQLVIKQIHPRLSGQRQFVDMFVAEAKILVSLTHGNIVPVYELGVVDDTYFIAMEYIDGPTLYRFTEAVTGGGDRIAPPVAAWIAAEILEGLDYAHRKGDGVIHRDLSPRNVMLSRDGEAKLVDFGIAVNIDHREADGDGAPTGSFPYMSPEQVQRQRLTAASDLFSAGVLLWEMLTGQRLFVRATADETLDAVLHAPIPAPSALCPDIPARLDEVVARALCRDVTGRWASAAEFLAALNRYLYALDPVPGARDVAALVARHCPPTPRVPLRDGALITAPATPTSAGTGGAHVGPDVDDALAAGPSTVAMPRPPVEIDAAIHAGAGDGVDADDLDAAGGSERPAAGTSSTRPTAGTPARGKQRGPTLRERSFATHVEFREVLARATPLLSFPALRDELAIAAPPRAARHPAAAQDLDDARDADASATTPTSARSPAPTTTPSPTPPARVPATTATTASERAAPPRRRWLAAALIAAGLLAGGGIAWRAGATRDDRVAASGEPRPPVAARASDPDVRPSAAPPSPAPDPLPGASAGPGGAAATPDVPPATGPRPAHREPRHPAAPAASGSAGDRAAAPAPAAMGRLKVGASPWGEVSVDGRRLGRTPGVWELAAGDHQVEIVFPGADVPQRKVMSARVKPGEEVTLFTEFEP